MDLLNYIAHNWDSIVSSVGVLIALLAHIRAHFPMPEKVGQIIDILAGNYKLAKNAD